jgi:transcription elongation GreA/GreB family factor
MAISRTTQTQIEKGNFDALEADWFTAMGKTPEDLESFVGIARALVGNGNEGRARTLLELYDDELRSKGLWTVRLALLRKAGGILEPQPNRLHAMILATLKQVHGQSKSFAGFLEKLGLQRATDDIPKTWDKVDRLAALLEFDVGAIGWMEGKGAGRVVEVNLELESFKVDFDAHKGLNVGFRAAGKLLKPLPPGHFLRRKLEEPLALVALKENDPPELLRSVLESYGRPMTAAEIKQTLLGLVSEKEWTGFWNAARKHPQVVASSSGRQAYTWAASGEDALAALWTSFQRADARTKMELLRRNAERDPALARRMSTVLVEAARQALPTNPGLAFEAWFTLERAGTLPEEAGWSPEGLLAGADWKRTVIGVEDRLLRERAYTMLRERRVEWCNLFAEALGREEDPRILDLLATGLAHGDRTLLDRTLDGLLSAPRKSPASFVWLAEKAADDEDLRARNPLRMFQQLVASLADEAFSSYRVRLRSLCESGSTLPRLIAHLDEEKAAQAIDAIARASGLEGYQRDALVNAIELRFPNLRKQVAQPLYATDASIAQKKAELRQLLEAEIPANRKAIEEARALGDLRENFEYKSARQRHEYLAARVATLHRDLERAAPIDPNRLETDEIRIGARVTLRSEAGAKRTVIILGPWESRPEEGIVSYESELAQTLLGKRVGDSAPIGETLYAVAEIAPYRGA